MSALAVIRAKAIAPALAMLPERMTSPQAEVQLLATHLQEAPNREQCQLPVKPGKCGPARGIWQFERGGGVAGVLRHPASRPHVLTVCAALGVTPTLAGIFDALPTQCDVLDAALARLLYWTDPFSLPALGDEQGAWDLYLRTWRPGKPHRKTWDALYAQALAEVASA